ncbi:class I SAM-dependent methyltransferase [Nocardia vinacea]|uniref:class I SAM-dependent methyltransferase n=1 Tax=Nocardia vinacea TaxID=96468 RepID=UPI003400FEF6
MTDFTLEMHLRALMTWTFASHIIAARRASPFLFPRPTYLFTRWIQADATSDEVKKLYEYWVEHHDFPYDVQHEWIPTIGHNCAALIKSSGRDLSTGSLLDLASGTGLVSKGIREKTDVGGLHVCFDLTEAALRKARSKAELTGANFVNGNLDLSPGLRPGVIGFGLGLGR